VLDGLFLDNPLSAKPSKSELKALSKPKIKGKTEGKTGVDIKIKISCYD